MDEVAGVLRLEEGDLKKAEQDKGIMRRVARIVPVLPPDRRSRVPSS
jgi:hypothetical protein